MAQERGPVEGENVDIPAIAAETAPVRTRSRSVKKVTPPEDPVKAKLDALNEGVTEMEEQAERALRNRWESVAIATGKFVGGGAILVSLLASAPGEVGAFTGTLGLIGGGFLAVNGIGDFAALKYKFKRASALADQSTMLRTQLTSEYETAIAEARTADRFKALEQQGPTPPQLPGGQPKP